MSSRLFRPIIGASLRDEPRPNCLKRMPVSNEERAGSRRAYTTSPQHHAMLRPTPRRCPPVRVLYRRGRKQSRDVEVARTSPLPRRCRDNRSRRSSPLDDRRQEATRVVEECARGEPRDRSVDRDGPKRSSSPRHGVLAAKIRNGALHHGVTAASPILHVDGSLPSVHLAAHTARHADASPICPPSFAPQHHSEPSIFVAHVWLSPAPRNSQSRSSPICTGTRLSR
jgi:hypothetical protein